MPDTPTPRPAPLGRLLLLAQQRAAAELLERLAAAGFDDQRMAHNQVFPFIPPEGIRLTALADAAGMTKQAMGELVDDLERLGYLERVPDPTDGRAKLIRFTERGWRAVDVALDAFDAIESDWEAEIGRRRMTALRSSLATLTGES